MTCDPTTWQVIVIMAFGTTFGFLMGAALFYPVGRRHGITVMAEQWRKANAEDAARKVHRIAPTKDRSP